MSNRPVARITVKNTNTSPPTFTDIAVIWPNKFGDEDGTLGCKRGITIGSSGNRNPQYDVTAEQAAALLVLAGTKGSGYFIDMSPPFESRETAAEGSETAAEFA